ncbi:MAG TPA: RNA methyltransferase [Thermoanaerobaculia bacterium]|nr:RNA methyltransferase [Thermoanaerobaculia bacterium]
MKTISSRSNVWFKRVKQALREHRDEIVIEGPKQVTDAVRAGWKPIAVFHKTSGLGPRASVEFEFTPELFDSLAETKSPQNVLALFERPKAEARGLRPEASILVALDGVQDPGNVGTIVRLAAAFECAGVVLLPGCADAYSPKAIRASAGTLLSVPIVNATIDDLAGMPLYAADARGETSAPPARDAVIVFGSEGGGVSDEIRRIATSIAIPMSPRVESLNVAMAAAILLSKSYEARHGR